jgi:large subunit ribosomal protein L9
MKVILTSDVYKHGVAGEVVEVADGFARNHLLPKGLAIKATPSALKQAEALRAQAEVRRAQMGQEFGEIAAKIEELTLYFPVKASETGKLYGSVTMADVAAQLNEQVGLEIDKRRVGDRPLRELGEHHVVVRLSADLAPHVRVIIHREGETPEETLAEVAELAAEAAEAVAEDAAEGPLLELTGLPTDLEVVGEELLELPPTGNQAEVEPADEAVPDDE